MAKTIEQIIKKYEPEIKLNHSIFKSKLNSQNSSVQSHTSLLALLYNKGCIMCSDLKMTSGSEISSVRQKKLFQIGEEPIVIAGTGVVYQINEIVNLIDIIIQDWKSEWELAKIFPESITMIIKNICCGLSSEEDSLGANFLIGGMNDYSKNPFIASIDQGIYQMNLFQFGGSGSDYIYSRAQIIAEKVLATLNQGNNDCSKRESSKNESSKLMTVNDIYQVLDQLNFPRETAMTEALAAIHGGPSCDVLSGGLGYQMMVIDATGVNEYIIPLEIAMDIIHEKQKTEYAAINSNVHSSGHLSNQITLAKYNSQKVKELFESAKRS